MSLYILDTDHISLVQRGNQNIALRSAGIPPEFIAITVISVEEQLRGRFAKIREAESRKNCDGLLLAYRNLRVTFESLAKFSILDFTALIQEAIAFNLEGLREDGLSILESISISEYVEVS